MQGNTAVPSAPYVLAFRLSGEAGDYTDELPALRDVDQVELHPHVTFLVGENGSGKSTLIEAIAIAARFNAEGGSQNFNFATRRSESELHTVLRLVRGVRRPKSRCPRRLPWPQACCLAGFKTTGPNPSSARGISVASGLTPSGIGRARSKWPKFWSDAAGSSP